MNINLISFTRKGGYLNKKLGDYLVSLGYSTKSYSIEKFAKDLDLLPMGSSLKGWTEDSFKHMDFIIFIGAAGIAVRLIAPFIKSKDVDPGVLVIDEEGKFVIPILSGHIGGANKLSKKIAKELNATEVITTATDINKKFAIDNFAVEKNLHISDINMIKKISSKILEGENVPLYSDFDVKGNLPKGIALSDEGDTGICISLEEKKVFDNTMNLVPKIITLGIGCRKNTPFLNIEDLVLEVLKENNISINSVKRVASIDLKKEEEGLLEFCKKYNLEFKVYSAEELKSVPGDFTESSFVKSITGVSNVCERAAVKGSNNSDLILRKRAKNGATVAIAKEEWSVDFE
ncbi:MAG: cobalamin biosynthesis protein CbiG [Clostridium sp.]|nr:cobalamin biosynthesis protein CbiG [Clostridium sp.]